MFRHFYAYVGGEKKDIVNGGELACAFFVSFILYNFKLINDTHLTVDGTEKDLQQSGWYDIKSDELKEGCVLIWQAEDFDGDIHKHIGFYVGNHEAISTSAQQGIVVKHNSTFDITRQIEKSYWTDKL